jgi:hypothetical protein
MSGFRLPVIIVSILVIVFYKVVHLNLEVLVQHFDNWVWISLYVCSLVVPMRDFTRSCRRCISYRSKTIQQFIRQPYRC